MLLIKNFLESIVDIKNDALTVLYQFKIFQLDHNFVFLFLLTFILFTLLWYLLLRKVQQKDIIIPSFPSVLRHDKPRFRKRDKIRYYATRLNRKFQELTTRLQNIKSKDQKQRLMSLFAKKILDSKEKTLYNRQLPKNLLEPDIEENDKSLPEDFALVMEFLKVFGTFDRDFMMKFAENVETLKLEAGDYLFKIGELDDNVFIVKSGNIRVFIEENGVSMNIRDVERGGIINSFLSVLDVIVGNTQPYKTVQALAEGPSEVLRFRAHLFTPVFRESPETMVRVVQLIALRLQRVTFLSLHHYLGLLSELINKDCLALPDCEVVKYLKENPDINDKFINQLSLELVSTSPTVINESTKQNPNVDVETGGIKAFGTFKESTSMNMKSTNFQGLELGEAPDPLKSMGSAPNIKELNIGNFQQTKRNLKYRPKHTATVNQTKDDFGLKQHAIKFLQAAKTDIGNILGLKDLSKLSKLKLTVVPDNTTLVREGEEDTHVYFVVTGELVALQHNLVGSDASKLSPLFIMKPGELCGIESVITTEPSFYTIRASTHTQVVVLQREMLYTLFKNEPNILLKLSNLLVRRMSPFLRQIDFALEWTHIKAGLPLYMVEDVPKSVYIVLNGRFRQIQVRSDGSREIVNELGRGELIGFVEVLCDQFRATTMMAIRDSEVAVIPSGLLKWIKYKAPQVVTRLIQLFADRLFLNMRGPGTHFTTPSNIFKNNTKGTLGNLRTVAIIPSTLDVPVEPFVLELQHSMRFIGACVRINSDIIMKRLGAKALESVNESRLVAWLNQQEDDHRMVFYVADPVANSVWTKRCIRQADCMIVVALAKRDPKLTELERGIESDHNKVSKILVLLYPSDTLYPPIRKTSEWLNFRPWITHHFHIRCPKRVFTRKRHGGLLELYKRVFALENPSPHSDMSRLARIISGTAIGIVLGGGGARGCSHVGIIKSLHEAGIPIDMIGGTSIGSLMGAIWAEETRITQFTQRAREYCKEMSNLWNILMDLTYSPVSLFSGKRMNMALEKVFKDRQIEDLWIPFFAITTDITKSKMRVHTSGSLWRFIRASMSLCGYLPPLCHPDDGSLLVDGGYTNNVPADVMNDMGVDQIFAVDVGSVDDQQLSNYGDWLSLGKLLYHRFIAFKPLKVLSMTEIQSRLAYVSCVRQLGELKETNICEYMRPPIDCFQTLQFGAFEEIMDVGYKYAKMKIDEWQEANTLKHFNRGQFQWHNKERKDLSFQPPNKMKYTNTIGTRTKTNTSTFHDFMPMDFKKNIIDLTEVISKMGPKEKSYYDSEADSEQEFWTKIRMQDDDESAVEILYRNKVAPTSQPPFIGIFDRKSLIAMPCTETNETSDEKNVAHNHESECSLSSKPDFTNWKEKTLNNNYQGQPRLSLPTKPSLTSAFISSNLSPNRTLHSEKYRNEDPNNMENEDDETDSLNCMSPGSDEAMVKFDPKLLSIDEGDTSSKDDLDSSGQFAVRFRRLFSSTTTAPIPSVPDKYDETGYDEDLEDQYQLEAASDPESFSRVMQQHVVHKRRHRRRSLNRLHKSISFDPGSEDIS